VSVGDFGLWIEGGARGSVSMQRAETGQRGAYPRRS
jgi:hypothetical protein